MFRRVVFENWQLALAAKLFLVTALGYAMFLVWSLRMKKDAADRRARLPLAEQPEKPVPASSHETRT